MEPLMPGLDLVIRGGQVVTAGSLATADLGIAGGVVARIGGDMQADAEIEAAGLLILPGGPDAHFNLSIPPGEMGDPSWVDDFASGSAAALAGGITTLGNMTFPAEGGDAAGRAGPGHGRHHVRHRNRRVLQRGLYIG